MIAVEYFPVPSAKKNSTISNALICLVCQNGFYLNSNSICVACNSRCLTCTGGLENDCSSCSLYTYLDSSNYCHNCDSSCQTCTGPSNSSSDCSKCNINYGFNINNECAPLICDETCQDCVGTTAYDCYSCHDGYFLNTTNSTCDVCSISCKNCYGAYSDQCLSCSQNFTLIESICQNSSELSQNDIETIKTLEGLNNLTTGLNINSNDSSVLKNYTENILTKISNLTSNNSSNLSSNDLSSLGNIISSLLNLSSQNNESWNSAFTNDCIVVIKEASNFLTTLAKTTGILEEKTVLSFMSSLSDLNKLNSDINDTSTKKTNEKNVLNAANAIIDANIYVFQKSSSIS